MVDYFIRQALALLHPIGFVWGCLVLLTFVLARRKSWGLAALSFLLVGVIFLFGSTGFPGNLVQGLERPYAGVKLAELPVADAIVLLGGGAEASRYEAGQLHFTNAGDRIITALELARLGKAPVLVLGGAGVHLDGVEYPESNLVHRWITERRLVDAEVLPLARCTNTHDEAVFVRELAKERGWRNVILVTSAFHMKRAAATFKAAGVTVIPAPCNFHTEVSLSSAPPGIGVPGPGGFVKVSIWMHEKIGWVVYRRRGWIGVAEGG